VNREELRTVLDFLRKGDVLMVTRIDRLPRSIGELQDIVRTVRAKGASLKATGQPIDTSTAAGKCFLDMLGACGSVRDEPTPASLRLRAIEAGPRAARPPHPGVNLAAGPEKHEYLFQFGLKCALAGAWTHDCNLGR
jgi:hypothetical protein